jgi:hypothetical protein
MRKFLKLTLKMYVGFVNEAPGIIRVSCNLSIGCYVVCGYHKASNFKYSNSSLNAKTETEWNKPTFYSGYIALSIQ